jgi:DNA repair exonuclease SbcCD ATPase subunit
MRERMKTKIVAVILAASLLVMGLPLNAQAGAPKPSVDEAIYVNLDYYGKQQNTNIVKSCTLNGNKTLVDYGSYKKVTNMSNETKPVLSDNSVEWSFDEDPGRFYFECAPKNNNIVLPWTIDISYKLNGVPIRAEKLAGASGLIETTVDITPNEAASDYYKNNLLLSVMTIVDMSKTQSVDAPGAQLQSMGQSTMVMFAALPGEKTTFTMRVGAKRFKTSGILISAVPGTMDQLKDIKDIKEYKDTFKDSIYSVSDSTNDILQTVDSMSNGLAKVQSGLSSLKSAQSKMSSAKDGLYDKSDIALADLSATTSQIAVLTPYLKEGQQAINDASADINEINKTMTAAKSDLATLNNSISTIQSDMNEMRGNLQNIRDKSDETRNLINRTESDISSARGQLTSLKQSATDMSSKLSELKTSVSTLKATLQYASSATTTAEMPDVDPGSQAVLAALQSMNTQTVQMMGQLVPTLQSTENVIDATIASTNGMVELLSQTDTYLDDASSAVSQADSYLESVDDLNSDTDKTLQDLKETLSTTKNLLNTSETLIDNFASLNNTMNRYEDSSVNALKDAEKMAHLTTNTLTSTKEFLVSFNAMVKASDSDLETGSGQSFDGLINVIEKSLGGINKTSKFKKTNNTLKEATDKEINKFEKENKLLNLDAEAKLVSFTSLKNPTPSSIQIVMRTGEIDPDSDSDKAAAAKKADKDEGVFGRMLKVVEKTWEVISAILS